MGSWSQDSEGGRQGGRGDAGVSGSCFSRLVLHIIFWVPHVGLVSVSAVSPSRQPQNFVCGYPCVSLRNHQTGICLGSEIPAANLLVVTISLHDPLHPCEVSRRLCSSGRVLSRIWCGASGVARGTQRTHYTPAKGYTVQRGGARGAFGEGGAAAPFSPAIHDNTSCVFVSCIIQRTRPPFVLNKQICPPRAILADARSVRHMA